MEDVDSVSYFVSVDALTLGGRSKTIFSVLYVIYYELKKKKRGGVGNQLISFVLKILFPWLFNVLFTSL